MIKKTIALSIITLLFIGVLPLSMKIAYSPAPYSEMRGIWRFDEGAGTTAYDTSGNANHGSLNDTCAWVTGKYNKAVSFDGAYDMIDIPDSNSLDVVGKITIEAWINLKNTTGAGIIAMKYNHSSLSSSYYLGLGGVGGNKFNFALSYNGNNYYQLFSTTNITLNVWTHVAAIMNGTHMLIYKDGVLDGNRTYPPGTIFAGTSNLRFGCYLPEAGYPRYFNGTIDEVKIFSYARSPPFTTWNVDDDRVQKPDADFTSIEAACLAAAPGDNINVYAGTYNEALYIDKSLTIQAASSPVIINGGQSFTTNYDGKTLTRNAVIFVVNSTSVVIEGFDIEGVGLTGPCAAVVYVHSGGEVKGCTVSSNTAHDMSAIGIENRGCRDLNIQDCIVKEFGRVGVYFVNCTGGVYGNTIIGQVYSDQYEVNYGIEVEPHYGPCNLEIFGNEIYNSDNTYSPYPSWSSAGIIVDVNRAFFDVTPSTVAIESNYIHNNYMAIELVSSPLSYAHYNNIYGNQYGVWVDPDLNNVYEQFDCRFNWWGDPTGPDPPGLGDNYDAANVDASVFLTNPFGARVYTDPDPVTKANGDLGTNFNVTVKIEEIEGFYGFDLKIAWDDTLLSFQNCYYNSTLDALWGSGNWFVQMDSTGGGGGSGAWYRLIALSTQDSFNTTGNQALFILEFRVEKICNFPLQTPLHFEIAKLSNEYWTPIPATFDDGLYQISGEPDLEFEVYDPNPSKPFEYCKTFYVKVYVTDIYAHLKDYDLTILYDTELLNLTNVDWTEGVLGNTSDGASYTELTPGTVHVVDTGGIVWSGPKGLLFTLAFHITFDDRIEHIWRIGSPHDLTAGIRFSDATLSFEEGTILMTGILMPPELVETVHLIRGDVTCDGKVEVADLRCVSAYYDQSLPEKYDLTADGIIDIFDLVLAATNVGYGV